MAEIPTPINHTVNAIYEALAKRARPGDGRGVSMSQAGHECDRAIWYKLRWASNPEPIDGRKQSIFDTGTLWESRLLELLWAAGAEVWESDPETGKQFSVALADGWLRGKMDGVARGVPEAPETVHVVECKSHSDKSFKEIIKKKLKEGKYDHWVQCQLYMLSEGLKRALYLAVNKNTDEFYAERVELDVAAAQAIEARIKRIVASDRTPSRLHDDPASKAAFICQWCPALAQCHEKQFARKNCRTCLHSSFESGATVRCVKYAKDMTYDEQQKGCPSHRYLPDLVPGEQIDVDGEVVIYRLSDGTEWRDE